MGQVRVCNGILGLALLAAVLSDSVGCSSRRVVEQDVSVRKQALSELPLAGPWSEPVGGLSCRVLLERSQATETSNIRGALFIGNVSDHAVTIASRGAPPFDSEVLWKDGQLPIVNGPSTAQVEAGQIRLEPGQAFVTRPSDLLLPPGVGQRGIGATLPAEGLTLAAPPVMVDIAAANWGPVVDGLRLRLGTNKLAYSVGETPLVHMFIHNMGKEPVTIHKPDWADVRMTTRGDLITLMYLTADDQYATIAGGLAWNEPIINLPLLAPGRYRLRVILQCPELSVTHALAWHGRLTSNDLVLEVKEK